MIGQRETLGGQQQSRPNAGYLTHVYLIATSGVAFVKSSYDNPGIGLVPGAMVTEVKCRPLTATLTEARQTGGDGEAYLVECQVPILTDAPELVNWVSRNARRRFVLLTRDTLGNCYLSGTPANGMRLSWGRQITARHSQNLVVRGLSLYPMARLASVDPEVLFPNREFDYSFDLSFS